MMKSVGFFLVVFGVGLVALLVVSGDLRRWLDGEPHPAESAARESKPEIDAPPAAARAKEPSDPNLMEIPFFDVEHGRLEYRLKGRLDDSEVAALRDIQEIDNLTLFDGQLEVPLYDDVVRGLPAGEGGKKARQFILTFASARYQAKFRKPGSVEAPERRERESEEVQLIGGGDRGRGIADDGTEFRFEELSFTINRSPESDGFFLMRSQRPVSISNGFLRLESPSGFEGKVFKSRGLEEVRFLPPVWTYLSPEAARLFSMESRPKGAGSEPLAAERRPPAPPRENAPGSTAAAAAGSKIAITCAGPLLFDLHGEPRKILFEKDVLIFPLEGAEPERGHAPPAPRVSYFQCQKLEIEVDSQATPPRPNRAVATWKDGRVRAFHQGRELDGDQLVWELPRPPVDGAAAPSVSEAVLTGKPTLRGPEGRLETGEVVFRLEEDRILLRGGITGELETGAGRLRDPRGGDDKKGRRKKSSERAEAVAGADARSGGTEGAGAKGAGEAGAVEPPQRWDFRADDGELTFAPSSPDAASRADNSVAGPRALKSFIAHSARKGGLLLQTKDGAYRLTGRDLRYDAAADIMAVEGEGDTQPEFFHGKDHGTAPSMAFHLEEGLLAARGGVRVELSELPAATRRAETGSGGGPGAKDAPSAKDAPAAPSPALERGVSGPIELLAREVDLRFDSNRRLLSAEARQAGPSPAGAEKTPGDQAVLRSLAPETQYVLRGKTMTWDAVQEVAHVEGEPGPAPGASGSAQLEYEGGRVLARKLELDKKTWQVSLVDEVILESQGAASAADPKNAGKRFRVSAGKAVVDLVEELRPPAPPAGTAPACASSRELSLIKRFHAWAPAGGKIELDSETFRGRTQEATWNGETQELHVFGQGRQEMVWINAGRESPFTAEEITYRCASQTVQMSGGVEGVLLLEAPAKRDATSRSPTGLSPPAIDVVPGSDRRGGASLSPAVSAAGAASQQETLEFRFQTSQVLAQVREGQRGLELVSLRAREHVVLENDRYHMKLTGDDLDYDAERREVRVFSEEGRPQTLTHSRPVEPAPAAAAVPGAPARQDSYVDRIDAREIWLNYRLTDAAAKAVAPGRPSPGPDLEAVVVKFRDDVNATFYGSDRGLLSSDPGTDVQRKWTLRSDHLGLRLSPDVDRFVHLALAEGNVIFDTRDATTDYMATGPQAFYEEAKKRLTLRGDKKSPARLIKGKTQLLYPEITLMRFGESQLQSGWGEVTDQEPPGLNELRRSSPGR